MNSLDQSVALFSQETARLEAAYRDLQAEFSRLHRHLSMIASHMSEGLIFISCEGIIDLFNEAAAQMLGVDPSLNHSSYWQHFSDTLFGFSVKDILKGAPKKEKSRLTLTSESFTREIELSSSFIPEKGLLLLLRDLTEQKWLEAAISRNDRLRDLGEMAAALAHEIRNPLGGIQGFACLLCDDLHHAPKQKEMAHAIVEGTQTLNRLVSNVLNFARPLELHIARCDIVLLIQEVVALLHAASPTPAIEISLPPSCMLYADKALLKMAFINLVTNARQASFTSPVYISLHETQKSVEILIEDKGVGIAKENLEKIFLPFFTTKPQGNGLGLPEAQKIIHAHGGTLKIESTPGLGTLVRVEVAKYDN